MGHFWDTVVRPFLEALRAPVITEIGSLFGGMTFQLLELVSRQGGVVQAIDPIPRFDVAAASERFGDQLRFHEARSHDVLDEIEPGDAVLIDGDHNWYTVHGELQRIEAGARRVGCDFPLVVLHDVDWPYARRDLYYDPDSIPEQWRHPWARRGIVWGQSELSDTKGINPKGAHALEEGGPRNGVLTAVEDFVRESSLTLELQTLPGFHGLGLLASSDRLDRTPALRAEWSRVASAEFHADHARRLAADATLARAERSELARRLYEANRRLEAMTS